MTFRSPIAVILCSAAGLVLGLLAYRLQTPHLISMNYCGVMAFASMGASLGCLMCEPLKDKR